MPSLPQRDTLLGFYQRHLKETLWSFWEGAFDRENGGVFTCFDNTGSCRISTDKFTWSQGRMVWVLAQLAAMERTDSALRESYIELGRKAAGFLMEHCLLENGHCAFVLTREGQHKPQSPGAPLDSSTYADCFVIIGLANLAAVTQDREMLSFAFRLYESVAQRVDDGTFATAPYATPEGYRVHGIPMIMLNTSHEMALALRALGHAQAKSVMVRATAAMHDILDHFVQGEIVHEMVHADGSQGQGNLLDRYINPGHTIEDMWFIIHHAQEIGDQPVITRAAGIARRAIDLGWDAKYGGLLTFADMEGGQPQGSTAGLEDVAMVQAIQRDWSNKLWWPHSEALYTSLLAYSVTGNAAFLAHYERISEYVFATFPNPDREIGEWIQIRDRQGQPEQKVVALPVKDPFHIIRNVLLIIELLQQWKD